MRKTFYVLYLSLFAAACHQSVEQHAPPAAVQPKEEDTENIKPVKAFVSQQETVALPQDDDCVFDTSYYRFTTDALRKYRKNIAFRWDRKQKQAMALLPGGDTLLLSIGGCTHFNYSAVLLSGIPFEKEEELIRKARWLAAVFFKESSFAKYAEYIDRERYMLEAEDEGWKFYMVTADSADEEITNAVYNGFSFSSVAGGKRTKIDISGYVN